MFRLSIRLLGPFQVLIAGQPAAGFDSDKVRALLAFLAVESNRPHRRQALAGLFWPDSPEKTARANLRRALSNLRTVISDRQTTNPVLCTTRQTIQFDQGNDAWVDVSTFRELLEQELPFDRTAEPAAPASVTIGADDREQREIARLAEAVANYSGPFLEGFSLNDNVAFEEWLVLKREQMRHQFLMALHSLARYHEAQTAYEPAIRYVWRQVEVEPWSEPAQRQLMRLLAYTGQRTAALDQFAVHKRTLAAELGVEPEAATIQLYQQIKDGEFSRETVRRDIERRPAAAKTLPFTTPVAFVGRDLEMRQLDDFLLRTLSGTGQVAFVTGEAGSGKTMLLQKFTRQAQAAYPDLIVAGGLCNATLDGGDPYLPFRQLLNLLAGDVQSSRASGMITVQQARRLWQLLPLTIQALLKEGPDLVETFIHGPALVRRIEVFAAENETWSAQFETLVAQKTAVPNSNPRPQTDLFQQYTRVLQQLAQQRPLLLTLDDLQWADTGSSNLLFHLSRQIAGYPIFIVGAYRPEEVAQGLLVSETGQQIRHPLETVINESQRHFGQMEVSLDKADGRHFVDAFLDTQPNRLQPSFRATFHRQTEGHPLFTAELWRGMHEQGNLVRDEAGWWVEGPELDWGRLPDRVEAVIAERIGRLPATLQDLLSIASIQGENFMAEIVALVGALDSQKTVQQLSGVLNHSYHLVRAKGSRHIGSRRLSHYRFRHFMFQKYLYDRLDTVQRAYYHEATGSALESLYEQQPQEMPAAAGQLARHFKRAGLIAKAITYLHLAGDRAMRLSAHEEAITHFSQAITLLDSLPDSVERTQQEIELQLALGVPLISLKGYTDPEVQHVYERARRLCQEVEAGPELIMALFWLASYYSTHGELETGLAVAQQMLTVVQRFEVDDLHIILAHLMTGLPLFHMGRFDEALVHFQQATAAYKPKEHQALAYRIGQDPGIASLIWRGHTNIHLGYLGQAQQFFQEALAWTEMLDHPFTLAFTLLMAGVTSNNYFKRYETALLHARSMVDLAKKEGFGYFQLLGMYYLGLHQVLQALANRVTQSDTRIKEGITQMQQALRESGSPLGMSSHLINLAAVYGQIGHTQEGLHLLDEAQMLVNKNGSHYFEPELYRVRGELLLQDSPDLTQAEAAEKCFWQAIEIARKQQARHFELRATVSLCRLWQQQGKAAAAHELLAAIFGWFTEGFEMLDLQEAQILLAELKMGVGTRGIQ